MNAPLPLTLPTPFAVGPVNCWLLPGAEPTLIDVGPRTEGAWQALGAGLAAHGLRPADIAHLVITHAHPDHYGQAATLCAVAAPTVSAHPAPHNAALLTVGHAEWVRTEGYMAALLVRMGVPVATAQRIVARYVQMECFVAPVAVDRWLAAGDRLHLGDAVWEVLHLPGHASGQIGLWQPDRGWLIGADHLLPTVSSNALLEPPAPAAPRPRPLLDYFASLDATAALPIQRIFPGHGAPFGEHRPLIARRLAMHEARAAALCQQIAAAPATPWALVAALFPGLDEAQWFLAISEVLGHLDWLEARERITRHERDDGVWLYEAIAE